MNFWEECAEANAVVVPVRLYERESEDDGYENFIGMRYIAFHFEGDSIAHKDHFFVQVDDQTSNPARLFNTPEGALAYKKQQDAEWRAAHPLR